MILANEEALTRPSQYYVTVCLSVPPTKQFCEVLWFVCLSHDDQPRVWVWNTVYLNIPSEHYLNSTSIL